MYNIYTYNMELCYREVVIYIVNRYLLIYLPHNKRLVHPSHPIHFLFALVENMSFLTSLKVFFA